MYYFIYTLIDPRDNLVHYVGITNNPNVRYAQHLQKDLHNEEKNAWMQDLQENGLRPGFTILETIEGQNAASTREKHWIRTYLAENAPLTNIRLKPSPRKEKATCPKTITTKGPRVKAQSKISVSRREEIEQELDRMWKSYNETGRRYAELNPKRNPQRTSSRFTMFVNEHRVYNKYKGVIEEWAERTKETLPVETGPFVLLSIPI